MCVDGLKFAISRTPRYRVAWSSTVVVVALTRLQLFFTRPISYPSVINVKGKGKGFPYSIPSVGPGADPGVQSVSLQVTVSHPPGGRLPLLSPGLQLPPQPQSITALWPVAGYTAW